MGLVVKEGFKKNMTLTPVNRLPDEHYGLGVRRRTYRNDIYEEGERVAHVACARADETTRSVGDVQQR